MSTVITALIAACTSKACAPPPVGTGGSKGGSVSSRGVVDVKRLSDEYYSNMSALNANDRLGINMAVGLYVSDTGYIGINHVLRKVRGRKATRDEQAAITNMDRAFETVAPSLTRKSTLYRGMLLPKRSPLLKSLAVGKEFVSPSYVSTSTVQAKTDPFRRDYSDGRNVEVVMKIVASRGTRVLPGKTEESELILARGTKFRVRSVSHKPSKWFMSDGKMIEQPTVTVTVEVVK